MDGRPENGRPFSCPDTLQKGPHLVEILPSRSGFDAAGDIDGGGIYLTHGLGHVFRCETAGEDDLPIGPETYCLGAKGPVHRLAAAAVFIRSVGVEEEGGGSEGGGRVEDRAIRRMAERILIEFQRAAPDLSAASDPMPRLRQLNRSMTVAP